MTLEQATKLIRPGVPSDEKQQWAELGAGTGSFTKALASLLPSGSTIFAVDRDPSVNNIQSKSTVTISPIQQDFTAPLVLPTLHGILMANALHCVSDQKDFLTRYLPLVSHGIIIVEYDMDTSNRWVPFPVSFSKIQQLVQQAKLGSIEKLGHTRSEYHPEGVYACLIQKGKA